MHGGAVGSGAPTGQRNGSHRTGWHTQKAIAERRMLAAMVAEFRAYAKSIA
jgi:hypothetical protein